SGRYQNEANGDEVDAMTAGRVTPSERDKERIIALYDSNVSYQDDLVRRVIDALPDDTMLVITADHGDELWEDGRVGHGASLRDPLIHVPLIVHYPPLYPAASVDDGVEHVDILPTLLDAAGAAPIDDAQGEPLRAVAYAAGRGYPRPGISSLYENAHAM